MTAAAGLDSLPPLREVIRAAGLSARKSLGQNFLFDLNITRRIARAAGPLQDRGILEIGPGPGGLTRALLAEGARRVVAVERDERFRPALTQLENAAGGRLTTLFADALATDYGALAAETGVNRVVANLPYNIGTVLIVRWLTGEIWPPWFDKLVVMLQREVAERFVAAPGGAAYGRLAVVTQLRFRPRLLFTLPPRAFTPSPKVASALLEIVPFESPAARLSMAHVERLTAAAFGQRRKMLRSSLAALGLDTLALLKEAGIDSTLRAEQLDIGDFERLTRLYQTAPMKSLLPRPSPA